MPRQKSTHVDDPRAVGLRLRTAREAAGLSQRQLAFPGCSPAYISRIESGDRIPSLQLLRELGRRLGVSEDFLATGSDPHERDSAALEADVAVRLDELDLAESRYAAILEDAGDDSERSLAYAGLGQVAYRRGEPRLAIEHFETALELSGGAEGELPDLADSLGRAHALVGELESSIAVFERSLAAAERREDELERIRFQLLLGEALIDERQLRPSRGDARRRAGEREGLPRPQRPHHHLLGAVPAARRAQRRRDRGPLREARPRDPAPHRGHVSHRPRAPAARPASSSTGVGPRRPWRSSRRAGRCSRPPRARSSGPSTGWRRRGHWRSSDAPRRLPRSRRRSPGSSPTRIPRTRREAMRPSPRSTRSWATGRARSSSTSSRRTSSSPRTRIGTSPASTRAWPSCSRPKGAPTRRTST